MDPSKGYKNVVFELFFNIKTSLQCRMITINVTIDRIDQFLKIKYYGMNTVSIIHEKGCN